MITFADPPKQRKRGVAHSTSLIRASIDVVAILI